MAGEDNLMDSPVEQTAGGRAQGEQQRASIDSANSDSAMQDGVTMPAGVAPPTEASTTSVPVPSSALAPPATAAPPAAPAALPPEVTNVIPAIFVPLQGDFLAEPFEPPRGRIERAQAMLQALDIHRAGVRRGIVHLARLSRRRILAEVAAREAEEAEAAGRESARRAARDHGEDGGAGDGGGGSGRDDASAAAPLGDSLALLPESSSAAPDSSSPPVVAAAAAALVASNNEIMAPEDADALLAAMRVPAVAGLDYSVTDAQLAQHLPLRFAQAPGIGERAGGRREAVRRLQDVVEQAATQMAGYDGHVGAIRARWAAALAREQQLLDARFGALPREEADDSSNKKGMETAMAAAGIGGAELASTSTPAEDVTMGGT